MVDYSKWDKYEFSESDEDSEDEMHPRVTRLGDNASVQIGPKGATAFSSNGEVTEFKPTSDREPSKEGHTSSKSSSSSTSSTTNEASKPPHTTIKPTKDSRGLITTNGSSTDKFSWSQNRYEVIIQAIVPAGTKASEVSFDVKDDFLSVSISGEVLFGGDLAYTIKVDDDDNISGGVVWELRDYSTNNPDEGRLLEFTLFKESPIKDSFVWWKHVYLTDDPIDTTKIQGRTNKVMKLKEEWDEAHNQFKEYIRNFKPTLLDIDDKEQEEYKKKLRQKHLSKDSLDFTIDEIENETRKRDDTSSNSIFGNSNDSNKNNNSTQKGRVLNPNIEAKTLEEREELIKQQHDWYCNNNIEDVMDYLGDSVNGR